VGSTSALLWLPLLWLPLPLLQVRRVRGGGTSDMLLLLLLLGLQLQ
jgi:hypothetical protein